MKFRELAEPDLPLFNLLELMCNKSAWPLKRPISSLFLLVCHRLTCDHILEKLHLYNRNQLLICMEDLVFLADALGQAGLRKDLAMQLCSLLPKVEHHPDVPVPREMEMQRKRNGACDVFAISNLMGNAFEKYLIQNAVHYSLARSSESFACTSLLLHHPKKASPKFIADCFLLRLRAAQQSTDLLLRDVETIQALLPSIVSHLSQEERETLKVQMVQSKVEAMRARGDDDQHFLVAYLEGVKRHPNSNELLVTTIGNQRI